MLVEIHSHRRVKAPSCSMWNNERIKLLGFQTVNQRAWRFSNLETRRGQIGNRSIGVAQSNLGCLLQEATDIKICLSASKVTKSQRQRYQIFSIGAQRIDRHTARCNRSFGQFRIIKALEDNVFMTKMIFRNLAHLRPFKANKADHIRLFTIA